MGRSGPPAGPWIAATAIGMMVGLGVGAAAVDYAHQPRCADHARRHQRARRRRRAGTGAPARSRPAGSRVAARACRDLGDRLGRSPPPSASTVDQQFTVFGSVGAIAVTALTAVLPLILTRSQDEHIMTRHIVFGTGQVGRLVVEQLLTLGHDVVAVNRSGRGDIPGAELVAGDATDPAFTTRVAAGADVVYFCLNATNYDRWAEEFPPLQRAVLTGAEAAGARLVVLDNLYAYGPTGGRDLVETMPGAADLDQGRNPRRDDRPNSSTRTAPAASRWPSAEPRTTSARAPPSRRSARTVFGTALTGRTAQVMGNPDQPHSYSYTPDVAAALDHPGHPTRRDRHGVAPARRRGPQHPADHRPRLPISPVTGPAASPPDARRCACSD